MSTKEIYNIAYKEGIFTFEGGNQNQGMIVPHYNIRQARIEYYFIPSSQIAAYEKAKAGNQIEAYKFYGNMVPENTIKQANLGSVS